MKIKVYNSQYKKQKLSSYENNTQLKNYTLSNESVNKYRFFVNYLIMIIKILQNLKLTKSIQNVTLTFLPLKCHSSCKKKVENISNIYFNNLTKTLNWKYFLMQK